MPHFQYSALNEKGESASGTITAANEAEATQLVRALNLHPIAIEEIGAATSKKAALKSKAKTKGNASQALRAKKSAVGGRVKLKHLMIFTRQLATLLDAGLPLLRSLTVLEKQEPSVVLRATIASLADNVQGGSTFSESLAQHPRVFNRLYINMVKAGELGGVLEIVLTRLAEYQEKAAKLRSKINTAMIYPVVVTFVAMAVMAILMVFVVPKFISMFEDMGSTLPTISVVVFGISGFLIDSPFFLYNIIYVFLAGFGIFLGIRAWGRTPSGREKLDMIFLRTPILGNLTRKAAVSRFTRTLGTLVSSGVPILQAINITKETAGNVIVSQAIEKIHEAVKEGETIVTPMQDSGVFPSMVVSMVDVGEETGQLPEMLLKVAEVYDDEVDNAVVALTSVLEPMMIVILAVVVGSIVFALFLPLMSLTQSISG